MPLNETSIAGYAALTGTIVNVADAYNLPAGSTYKISRSFDEKSGYRTKSMLAVPMRDHKGKVIGVVQLINKKRDAEGRAAPGGARGRGGDPLHLRGRGARAARSPARPRWPSRTRGSSRTSRTCSRPSSSASVTAIEARDPTTLGHSGRVATLTVGLAEKVDAIDHGPFKDVSFTKRPDPGDRVREPAPRLRQGRRAREGAHQGQEALRRRAAADPPALRLHQALDRGRLPAREAGAGAVGPRQRGAAGGRWTRLRAERQARSTSS